MPFPFNLPTTSQLSFTSHLSSNTHPSLPLTATTLRGVLRDSLKKHKRLPLSFQPSNLSNVLAALNEYLPHLFALDTGLSGGTVAGEEIHIVLEKELEVEWRARIAARTPGREASRVKGSSIEYEIIFALTTLACIYSLLARRQLHTLYGATTPSTAERTETVALATQYLLQSGSIHQYLVGRCQETSMKARTLECMSTVQSGLASLAIAEATLQALLKDDPYPAAVVQDRNKNDKDWMIKSPDIPKVRAHLFARLSLAAADHASKTQAMLGRPQNVDSDLIKYLDDLRCTARAKACRFLAIDADLTGKTGEAIAWLRGGKKELGLLAIGKNEEKKAGAFSKLKKDWTEKREDRKVDKGGLWGSDAGKSEEGRIIEMLEKKWVKMNDTMNTQLVPPSESLFASMPSGREIHTLKIFVPPSLEEYVLVRMRAPPSPQPSSFKGSSDESDDEPAEFENDPVGAFPGTRQDYGKPRGAYY
ncbi:MAG: hypothetical protein M1827_007073 [Pycnora praestabilis]|nr:MAG: hypothetical protein M1827_007073 [Pycnora praestabilis]